MIPNAKLHERGDSDIVYHDLKAMVDLVDAVGDLFVDLCGLLSYARCKL